MFSVIDITKRTLPVPSDDAAAPPRDWYGAMLVELAVALHLATFREPGANANCTVFVADVAYLIDPAMIARYGELIDVTLVYNPWGFRYGDGTAATLDWIDIARDDDGRWQAMYGLDGGRVIKPAERLSSKRRKSYGPDWRRVFTRPNIERDDSA